MSEREWDETDAVRLYYQGWSIRRVAAEFGTSYGVMRRVLGKHVTLRISSGAHAARVRMAERIAEIDRRRETMS
jgi:transposase